MYFSSLTRHRRPLINLMFEKMFGSVSEMSVTNVCEVNIRLENILLAVIIGNRLAGLVRVPEGVKVTAVAY